MARDFNGSNERINFAEDAALDDLAPRTLSAWTRCDTATQTTIVSKGTFAASGTGSGWQFENNGAVPTFDLKVGFDSSRGRFEMGSEAVGQLLHVVCVYDHSSDANNPTFYVNGTSVSVTEPLTPAGSYNGDSGADVIFGERPSGSGDFNGLLGHVVIDSAAWDAAAVNRARWWGCSPGGPSTVEFWVPLWTSDLSNKGTATAADGTATGTTMDNASCPRVERMWGSMMGCGR